MHLVELVLMRIGGTCKGKLTLVHSAFTSTDTRNPHKQQKNMQLRNVNDTVQMQILLQSMIDKTRLPIGKSNL